MEAVKKIISSLFVFAAFVFTSNAQSPSASASAIANAQVATGISIVKVDDLRFGIFVVSASAGSVIIPADASGDRTTVGGVSSIAGAFGPASFTITGQTGAAYTISTPTTSVSLINGSNNMSAALTYSMTGGQTLTGGSATLYVGGTLSVAGSQASGSYATVANAIPITVEYN